MSGSNGTVGQAKAAANAPANVGGLAETAGKAEPKFKVGDTVRLHHEGFTGVVVPGTGKVRAGEVHVKVDCEACQDTFVLHEAMASKVLTDDEKRVEAEARITAEAEEMKAKAEQKAREDAAEAEEMKAKAEQKAREDAAEADKGERAGTPGAVAAVGTPPAEAPGTSRNGQHKKK